MRPVGVDGVLIRHVRRGSAGVGLGVGAEAAGLGGFVVTGSVVGGGVGGGGAGLGVRGRA